MQLDIAELEECGFNAWPAPCSVYFGGWVFRLGGGYTKRANSANALGDRAGSVDASTRPFAEVMAEAERVYIANGQPAIFRLTPLAGADPDAQLAAARYEWLDPSTVMTAALGSGAEPPGVRIDGGATPAWLNGVTAAQGVAPSHRVHHDRIVRAIMPPAGFATAFVGGAAAGYGLGALDRGAVGMFDIVVRPEFRGRGLGRAITRALMAWAHDRAPRRPICRCSTRTASRSGSTKAWGFVRPIAIIIGGARPDSLGNAAPRRLNRMRGSCQFSGRARCDDGRTMAKEIDQPTAARRDRTVLTSPRIRRLQLVHFLAFDMAPIAGVAVAIASWPRTAPSALDLTLFLALWAVTGLGLTVGYHRRFSHRAFQCSPGVDAALIAMAGMAARGPMFSWTAMHRRHHERSDREGDLHSPNLHGRSRLARLRGFAHAHFTWMARHDYPNAGYYIPDLLQQPALVRWSRRYYLFVAAGLAAPALIGGLATSSWSGAGSAFLWGGVIRLFVVEHTMNAINSLAHLIGDRPFPRGADGSRNLAWAAIATWGEAWHNNHHAFPWSAAFGFGARQPDPGFWFIRALERFGLAWDVKSPDDARIAARAKEA